MLAFSLRRTLAVAVSLGAALLGTVGAVPASAATPYCGITWGSLDKVYDVLRPEALIDVRTGRHDCYDRVVFDFQGPADGYRVGYGGVVSQARGEALSVAGGATLSVTLLEPAYDVETGASTCAQCSGGTGSHMVNVSGYRTLRDVVFGGSFEGYTTIGVGVRARLPFRVFTLAGPGGHSRIVIDVAHRWSR